MFSFNKLFKDLVFWFLLLSLTGLILNLESTPSPAQAAGTAGVDEAGPTVLHAPLSQDISADGIWREVGLTAVALRDQASRQIIPDRYRLVAADINALDRVLAQAPLEDSPAAQSAQTVLTLPIPDGSFQRFRIEAYAMLEPALAAKFPEIKTYLGWGLDDPTATVRLDRTPAGFHGLILSGATTVYIDPYSREDIVHYMSYYKHDYGNFWGKTRNEQEPIIDPANQREFQPELGAAATSGPTRRTYRLAVAATGEYTAFHGGAVGGALAAISTTMNRVNGIYERELSVRMTLIANNNVIIYTNAGTDPYTNNDGFAMLDENQANLDDVNVIGSANYDIGHVFSTGGGGVALLGSPCNNGIKAQGVTGSGNPVGDPFDVDFVAHEMGHQFGANHTFNAIGQGSCGGGNRNGSTAYEPGSGTTIMAYAGICGSQDIQPHSNDHFHGVSFDEIMAFVTDIGFGGGGVCAQTSPTNNTAPTVEAGPSYTIPKQTPFTLTGSATDGDSLTYHWEQFNLGPAWTDFSPGGLPNFDSPGNAVPIFRSYSPTTGNSRTFPALVNVLDGAYKNKGESLPNIGRTLNFRLTARDNKGGVASDSMSVTVNSGSGPFRVTAPTGTVVWSPGTTQSVAWNPANTAAAPVNCPNVNILLSVNGGSSFTPLLAGTPNDGSQNITVLDDFSSNAYIKVQCANNIFFNVSNASLTICTPLLNDSHEAATSNWTPSQSSGSNPWTRPNNAANAYSGSRYWFVNNLDSDSDSNLDSPTLTASSTSLLLRFFHKYNLEPNGSTGAYDGGLLEIKIGGGGWSYIEKNKFTKNGYNRTMGGSPTPITGKQVFSGNSGGYIESIVDLSSLVGQGQNFQIRFREVNDFTTGVDGWYVDDVFICGGDASTPPGVQSTVHLPLIIKN